MDLISIKSFPFCFLTVKNDKQPQTNHVVDVDQQVNISFVIYLYIIVCVFYMDNEIQRASHYSCFIPTMISTSTNSKHANYLCPNVWSMNDNSEFTVKLWLSLNADFFGKTGDWTANEGWQFNESVQPTWRG